MVLFSRVQVTEKIQGKFIFISGHTRYSTFGGSDTSNIQPFVVETLHGLMAVAHNGELVNSTQLKQKVDFLANRNGTSNFNRKASVRKFSVHSFYLFHIKSLLCQ